MYPGFFGPEYERIITPRPRIRWAKPDWKTAIVEIALLTAFVGACFGLRWKELVTLDVQKSYILATLKRQ